MLDGEDATVASGIAVARQRLGAIAGWAALVASVNIVIRGLAERAGPLGDLLLGGIAVAWNLVTFLAVPVLTLEGTGPIETLKRSAHIFRERWGEQITGQVSIGAIVVLVGHHPRGHPGADRLRDRRRWPAASSSAWRWPSWSSPPS